MRAREALVVLPERSNPDYVDTPAWRVRRGAEQGDVEVYLANGGVVVDLNSLLLDEPLSFSQARGLAAAILAAVELGGPANPGGGGHG